MLYLKSFILFVTLIKVVLSITTPGIIDHSQYTDVPNTLYFTDIKMNGIQAIQSGCSSNYYNSFNYYLIPIVAINGDSYLSYGMNQGQHVFAIISSTGSTPIEIQSSLNDYYDKNDVYSSVMFYDDKRNSFIFMNYNNILEYDISANTVTQLVGTPGFAYTPSVSYPYYDMTSSTLFVSYDKVRGNSSSGIILIHQMSQTNPIILSIVELNLQYEINSISVSGYNGQLVLFGLNSDFEVSVLYLVDPQTLTYTVLALRPYGYKFVSSANPRYVLIYDRTGSNTELYDLETKSSLPFTNTCTTHFQNNFITSIAAKGAFQ